MMEETAKVYSLGRSLDSAAFFLIYIFAEIVCHQ